MQKTKLFMLVILLVVYASCKKKDNDTETPDVNKSEFNTTFGGSANDYGNSLVESADHKIFCFGTTSSITNGGKDFYLVQTDINGNKLAEKHFGGISDETGYSIIKTSDNGMMMAGCTNSQGSGLNDMYIIKTDKDGNSLFIRYYGTVLDEVATSLVEITGQGFLLGGYQVDTLTGKNNYLIRIDKDGNIIWFKSYGGPADDYINSLAVDAQGNFLVFGNTRSYGAGDQDFYLMKLNSNGDSLWTHTYGGAGYEQAGSIMQATDGFYLCGHTTSFGNPEHNAYLIKTDLNGTLTWEKNYGGMMHDGFEKGILTSGGNIVMTGYSSSFSAGDIDFLYMKTDKNGNLLETRSLGTTRDNIAFDVIETADAYFLTGYEKDNSGGTNLMLVKTKK